jgi:O-antigen/teichoic acid export membrane protein
MNYEMSEELEDQGSVINNQNTGAITENNHSNQDKKEKNELKNELWEKSGFTRVLAGFWYNYIFALGLLLYGILILGVLLPNFLLPYPEAMGYNNVVKSIFALFFTLMDVGVGAAVTRFVAEYVGKGQIRKCLEYIRFFIWFQMITGLIQITAIAIWVLEFARQAKDLQTLTWFFLLYSTIQFPGMLGVYSGALEGFQRFDKKNIVSFVQTIVLEMLTQIIFILLGRHYGRMNPQIGELMGATMGYIIGLYIDDFLAMLLAATFFSNILKPYGITMKETIIPSVSPKVAKQSLIFGVKTLGAGVFHQLTNLGIVAMTLIWLPNYATIIGLYTIADSLVRVTVQHLPTEAPISEAYNNGKKKLADYIMQGQWKYYGILTSFLAISVVQIMPIVIVSIAAGYGGASWMIPYLMISRLFVLPIQFSDRVQKGCNKPEYLSYSLMVEQTVRFITYVVLLSPGGLSQSIPNYNFAIAYLFCDLPAYFTKMLWAWFLIHRNLIKVKIPWWQMLSPVIAVLPLVPINYGIVLLFTAYGTSSLLVSIVFALFILIFLLFGAPILVVFPILGLIGGWDERQLEHLRDAAEISGPSKGIVKLLYKGANWGYKHSPFKKWSQKFRIPWEDADREAYELLELRKNGEIVNAPKQMN